MAGADSIVEQLKKQEEQMAAAVTGDPVLPPEEPGFEPAAPTVEPVVIAPIAPEPVETEPQKPKRTNWKKRFTNYKSQTDPKLAEVNSRVSAMQAENATLQDEIHRLNEQLITSVPAKDPFEDTFTPEQTEAFGPEGLEVVKTAAQTAAKAESEPLKVQLAEERKLRRESEDRRRQEQVQTTYDKFIAMLAVKVPDYAKLDTDSGFHEWMSYQDPDSIYSRRYLFERAEEDRNAGVIARYMLDYKKAVGAAPSNPLIDKHITPSTVAGPEIPLQESGKVQPMSMGWIRMVTDDINKGKYNAMPGEAKKLQDQIDNHLNMGYPLKP